MVIYITGFSMVIERLESRQLMGRTIFWMPDTWAELFLFAAIAGLLRGLVVYGIGGWWFRVRLGFCGDKRSERSITGRVYMLSGIAKQSSYIVIILIATASHSTFTSYLSDDGTWLDIVFMGLQLILVFWSSITLYFGVRAVFNTDKLWSVVWFLVLPILLRAVALAALIIGMILMSLNPEPELDQPSKHSSSSYQFEYPSNWMITEDSEVPGPETWLRVEPMIANAIFDFNIEYTTEDVDQSEGYLESIRDSYGMEISEDFKSLSRFGKFEGSGGRYTGTVDGDDYVINIFQTQLSEYAGAVMLSIVESSIEDQIQPGIDHVLKTLKITDPYTLRPNLDRTLTVKQDELEFEIPSNWWLSNEREEGLAEDDATPIPDTFTIEARTPGYGTFRVYVYNSNLGPRSELGVTINNYTGTDQLDNEQIIDQWHGISGYGAKGTYQSSGMEWNVTILISTLSDGRLIELQSAFPTDYAEYYTPGYDLIERTLRVNPDFIDAP